MPRAGPSYLMEFAVLVSDVLAFVPTSLTATMQTAAMSETMSAYSTSVAPSSSFIMERKSLYMWFLSGVDAEGPKGTRPEARSYSALRGYPGRAASAGRPVFRRVTALTEDGGHEPDSVSSFGRRLVRDAARLARHVRARGGTDGDRSGVRALGRHLGTAPHPARRGR